MPSSLSLSWWQLAKEQSARDGLIGGAGRASSNAAPSLSTVFMKLRQLCNHPLLLDKAEQTLPNLSDTRACGRAVEALVAASGKLQLLHKLLPQLRQAGRKLLIFSQMKRMLDLLEDYLALSFLPYERLDGSVAQKERQAAIDRFQVGGPAEAFAFLLSTKVCHLRMEDQISPDLLISPQISPFLPRALFQISPWPPCSLASRFFRLR